MSPNTDATIPAVLAAPDAPDAEDWLVDAALAPLADGSLAPLYAGAAAGELTLPFCATCGLALELEQRACDGCGATDIRWRPVERAGTVHAVTLVHRREPGLVRVTEPYPVVDIELTSGHRLIMTTLTATGSAPAIGRPVTVGFRVVGGVAVPAAVLSTTESSAPSEPSDAATPDSPRATGTAPAPVPSETEVSQ
ncbi:Zn-ribbon domain-containing OB-fold protein [Frankia sp. QA3]|uniref:Zn-ribbon domain-containing OB-fold protein n=1 Tax=Frankia sp. QA3 TaxID=710111 RepID=UPI000269BDC1|nr:OB-fold domain-containing protein [Frankia sp. QA3]EIV91850.1 putative nucleic-acid-binding protein containing a Zn-ribbon [Frankia sp. QA3]